MRLDLYQAETARIAAEQAALLTQAREIMAQRNLSLLEQGGMLHALQVLIENAIGKAKHLLKARGEPVPVSAYDTFAVLARCGDIDLETLPAWNAVWQPFRTVSEQIASFKRKGFALINS